MRGSAFFAVLFLAVVFLAAKASLVWPVDSLARVTNLLAISAEDLLVIVAFGGAAGVALKLAAKRQRVATCVWITIVACGAVAATYAILSVSIYRYFHEPLNARMLAFVGSVTNLQSSIRAHADTSIIVWAIIAPVLFIAVASFTRRTAPSGRAQLVVVGVASAWIVTGVMLRAKTDRESWQRTAGRNPHVVLVGSMASRMLLDDRTVIAADFPAHYLDDFKLAADRAQPPLALHRPRNVILVVLESTSAKYLSLHGSKFDTTPTLVAESKHAMVFERFYAHIGYTFCSMMPITRSVYPGLPWCYRPVGKRPMPPGLASLMKQRGHRTAFFSAGDPAWEGIGYMAKEAGMDEVFGPVELGAAKTTSWGTDDGAMIDGLVRWIDKDRAKPFFAIAWSDQAHHPYTVTGNSPAIDFLDEKQVPHGDLLERYLNAIRQSDAQLAKLFEALRSRGLADDTLVVITSDHGEAFGDPHHVVGHGGALFDENLHVPLMLWNPRLFPTGTRASKAGGHVDLNPTLAHILALDPPADWQGASLLSDDHPGRAYLLADRSGYQFGVTDGRYKHVMYVGRGFEKLFDLQGDPDEQRDLSTQLPNVAAEMRGRISAFVHAEEAYLNAAPTTRATLDKN